VNALLLQRFEGAYALCIDRLAPRNGKGELPSGICPEMGQQGVRVAREACEVFIPFAKPDVLVEALEGSDAKITLEYTGRRIAFWHTRRYMMQIFSEILKAFAKGWNKRAIPKRTREIDNTVVFTVGEVTEQESNKSSENRCKRPSKRHMNNKCAVHSWYS
jgi:hypothetical protein